jgi:uncharacterized membrane protein
VGQRTATTAGTVQTRQRYRHPVNQKMEEQAPAGQRIADAVTNFLGSWKFIVLQTLIVAAWVAGNIYLIFNFDPYPFIFLNLAFSTQAAYAAPLILLASNRSAVRDRWTLEHAAMQTDVEEAQNERLLKGMTDVLRNIETVDQRILGLEQRILELEQGIVSRLDRFESGRGTTRASDQEGGSIG